MTCGKGPFCGLLAPVPSPATRAAALMADTFWENLPSGSGLTASRGGSMIQPHDPSSVVGRPASTRAAPQGQRDSGSDAGENDFLAVLRPKLLGFADPCDGLVEVYDIHWD